MSEVMLLSIQEIRNLKMTAVNAQFLFRERVSQAKRFQVLQKENIISELLHIKL